MLQYSFFGDSKNSKAEAMEFLEKTDKVIKWTFGFKFRNPTTYEIPISNEKAIKLFKENSLTDVTEKDTWIDFEQYSSNDML